MGRRILRRAILERLILQRRVFRCGRLPRRGGLARWKIRARSAARRIIRNGLHHARQAAEGRGIQAIDRRGQLGMRFRAIRKEQSVEFCEIGELRSGRAGIFRSRKKLLNFASGIGARKKFAKGLSVAPGIAQFGIGVEDRAKLRGLGWRRSRRICGAGFLRRGRLFATAARGVFVEGSAGGTRCDQAENFVVARARGARRWIRRRTRCAVRGFCCCRRCR